MEANNQDKALAMELARILKPTAFELIKAIGDNKVLICIQPHGGICADINGKHYLVGWHNVNEQTDTEAYNEWCRKEGLPDWMYKEDDEPDKLTKAKNEEKERITMEIMECNGDKLRAAKHLGYDINTFLQKILEYNIH